MLYDLYQAQSDLLTPLRAVAGLTSALYRDTYAGPRANYVFKSIAAASEIFNRAHLVHDRPNFAIETIDIGKHTVRVSEEKIFETPFATLLRFRKDTTGEQPRVMIVAPMAGHFPTLLRQTVSTMLADHDVYITDWKSARDVPLTAGRFGIDEYIEHTIRFFEQLGPGAHVVAVCQPCAAVLATIAVMAQTGHPCQPRSMTLMAGPVDTRINPTAVNDLATGHPIEWFEKNLITTVPGRYAGAHRRVYPGFLQFAAFMSMNLPRHVRAHLDLFEHIRKGEDDKAEANKKFYDEYFSVADLPAEFYLETVRKVFQEFELPRGLFEYRGMRVEPAAIRKTALLTIEGERDDICSVGQTVAAHELCRSIKPFRKKHYVQPGVGHYGVFSGTRWQTQIYPIVRNVILASV